MEFLPLLLLPVLLLIGVGWVIVKIGEGIAATVRSAKARRRARIERELDQVEAEMRQAILALAQELDASAHEARKALIRESFLASGKLPDQQ